MVDVYGKKCNYMAEGVEDYWDDKCFEEGVSYYLIFAVIHN